jgi:hypothetical protein
MKTEDRVDELLDQALEMTFPASDPFTVTIPEVDAAGAAAPQRSAVELEAALR